MGTGLGGLQHSSDSYKYSFTLGSEIFGVMLPRTQCG